MRFKRNVVALMLAASFLSAINGVVFKLIAVDKGFWVSLFWGFVGQMMAGLTFLVCVPSYRRDFLSLFKQQKVDSFQPLFVFTFGVVLTLFFPRVAKESLGRMKMLQKGTGIGLMLVGAYLISR